MKNYIIVILLIVLSNSANAASGPIQGGIAAALGVAFTDARERHNGYDWVADGSRELATLTLIADWGTTRDIANYPRYSEKNPILREHPTNHMIDAWFMFVIASHYGINELLDRRLRTGWNLGMAWGEWNCCVHHNQEHGLSIKAGFNF